MSVSSITLDMPRPYDMEAALCNVEGPVTEVNFRAGDLWRMGGHSRWRVIVCLRGVVWVTQERDARDYVLTRGDMFLVTQPGTVLVAAEEDACIHVTLPLRTTPYRGRLPIFR
jgi:hypothetical protein